MNISRFFNIEYYANQLGFTKSANLAITQDKPLTDEDIERIDMTFVRKTREAVRWLNANGTDIGAIVTADVAGVIGSSVNIQSRVKDSDDLNVQVEDVINEWSLNCETSGRFHLNSALRAMVEFTDKDGGFLVRHHYNTAWNIPYKFELIEVGMINMDKHDEETNLLNGIQKDGYGKITGVHIFNSQERDTDKSTLVPYDEIIYFSPVWISLSQYTAISKFASILPTIDKMERYTDAELQKVIEEAKAGKYWRTAMYDDIMKIVKATKDDDTRKSQLSTIMASISETGIKPNGLTPIPLGDDVIKTDASSASVYTNINKVSKGNISSALGLSSQIVYQDSSDSNYSSIKAMMAFANIQWNIRWDDLEKLILTPILRKVIMVGVDKKMITAEGFYTNPSKFIKLEYMRVTEIDIEPLKTASANGIKLENGTTSKRDIARRVGRNYEDILRERLEDELLEKKMREDMGIPKEDEFNITEENQ